MITDPRTHSMLAADRAELLRSSYGPSAGPAELRRRLGLLLIALGRRLSEPRCTGARSAGTVA